MPNNNMSIIKNEITQITAEQINHIVEGDFATLKIAAKQFLDKVTWLSKVYEKAISQQTIKDKITVIKNEMKTSQQYTRQILQYQHHFETLLNEFLNKTVYLTYITRQGNFYFYDQANVSKLYAQSLKNKGRGRLQTRHMFDANDLNQNLKKVIGQSISIRKPVYETAIARFLRNKNDIKMKYERYEPTHNTYYWWKKAPNILGWTDPTSISRIAEGYAEAVINEAPDVESNNMEASLEALWNYVQDDRIPAAIRQDIVYKQDGNIQFAIKTSDFQTASVGQYFRLAYNITQISKVLTLEEFKKYLPGLINLNDMTLKILDVIQGIATEKIQNEVSKFLKQAYIEFQYTF